MTKSAKGNSGIVIIHGLIWIVIIVLPVYSARRFQMGSNFLITYYSFIILNALIFYTNYLFLVPALFFKKKRYKYYITALALVFCFYFISDFANEKIFSYLPVSETQQQMSRAPGAERNPPRQPQRAIIRIQIPHAKIVGYTTSSFFMMFLSLGLRVLERQSKIEKMQEDVEKAKLNTELAFLKNQISPHFFFNTLNNIYSLIDRSNEDSKDAIIKLSKLMRYVLNESGQDNRLLGEEIEFMNNYIDLMRLRIGTKTKLNVDFPVISSNIMIPHLLFISLIENAFKYGISVQEGSYVYVSLVCNDRHIHFKCENGLPESNNGKVLGSAGIGLDNLRKRLNLIYPGRHELAIDKTKDRFEVNLTINL